MLEQWFVMMENSYTIYSVIGLGALIGLLIAISHKISHKWSWLVVYPVLLVAFILVCFGYDIAGFYGYGYSAPDSDQIVLEVMGVIVYSIILCAVAFFSYHSFIYISENENYWYRLDGHEIFWHIVVVFIFCMPFILTSLYVRDNDHFVDYWYDYDHLSNQEKAEVLLVRAFSTTDFNQRDNLLYKAAENNPKYAEYIVVNLINNERYGLAEKALAHVELLNHVPEKRKIYLQALILMKKGQHEQAINLLMAKEYPWQSEYYLVALIYEYYASQGQENQALSLFKTLESFNLESPEVMNYYASLGWHNSQAESQANQYYGKFLMDLVMTQATREKLAAVSGRFVKEYEGEILDLPSSLQEFLDQEVIAKVEEINDLEQYTSPSDALISEWTNRIRITHKGKLPAYGPSFQFRLLFALLCSVSVMVSVGTIYSSWWNKVAAFGSQINQKRLDWAETWAAWIEDKKQAWNNWRHDPDQLLLEKAKFDFNNLMSQIPEGDQNFYFLEISETIRTVHARLPQLIAKRKFWEEKVAELLYLEDQKESDNDEIRKLQQKSKADLEKFKKQIGDCKTCIEVCSATLQHLKTDVNEIILHLQEDEVEKAKQAIADLLEKINKTNENITKTVQEVAA